MKNKDRLDLLITNDSMRYIESYMKKKNLSKTAAIEKIIQEHKSKSDDELDLIADKVVKKFTDANKDWMTNIRLKTGFTDKNVQILLEVVNTLFVFENIDSAYTTDYQKSVALSKCQQAVEERIKRFKEIKDNKPK